MEENQTLPEFFITMLKQQYGEKISNDIVRGYQVKRVVSFRVNTLKTDIQTIKQTLQTFGIILDEVPFSKEAFTIKNACEEDLQKLTMYEKGEIYLQSLSSMLPPIILNPKKGADILDMTAAPGGKTTQIAVLTNNEAHITACEMNKIRFERLKYNIEKQGATSVYAMLQDARQIDDFFSFDQILLDAPCSGSGTLDILNMKENQYLTKQLIDKSIRLQKALIQKAIKVLKPGCEMIYSTCSVLKQENEEIIKEVLNHKEMELIPISLEKFENLYMLPVTINGTICVCPNELYEGFFIAKLRKKI